MTLTAGALSTSADVKERWGGILEQPWISRAHRHFLDGFEIPWVKKNLRPFHFESLLDVCCGLGEYHALDPKVYVGLDNSGKHIAFGAGHYRGAQFIHGDAGRLPFRDRAFDAVLLACATHHFTEDMLVLLLNEIQRVSRRYIIIDDAVLFEGQSRASRLFYSLDRGTMFRTVAELERILSRIGGNRKVLQTQHMTFPGIYRHALFVLERTDG
ncbi:MAG: class I SAM-dependent methyltransferase [Candidatus Omnitrophota bacterium]|nr:class I SAM-dependent methyltransferase [Candidatus Omnitrophota bacterium]MDZ4241949.1 class I SAM-dependent methyltransferase [Candidatus Omnitrophota bacterium]